MSNNPINSTQFLAFAGNNGQARTLSAPCSPYQGILGSGWTIGPQPGSLAGPATTNVQLVELPLHDQAVLNFVTIFLTVATHTALPAELPAVNILAFDLTTRSTGPSLGGGPQSPTPATFGDWNSTSAFNYACTLPTWQASQSVASLPNFIDRANYTYWVQIFDEFGSGSVAGNVYWGIQANYVVYQPTAPAANNGIIFS